MADPVNAKSTTHYVPGVYGENTDTGDGVFGRGTGVGRGVVGESDNATGTEGHSTSGAGVWGSSETGEGVHGHSKSGAAAVIGINEGAGPGVRGHSTDQAGVIGESDNFDGVYGIAHGPKSAITGFHPDGTAGFFDGSIHVTHDGEFGGTVTHHGDVHHDGNVHVIHDVFVKGDVQLEGQDLAERFWLVGDSAAEPGAVVVLAGDDRVRVSDEAYDHRVAGVVSGASAYRPGLVLGGRNEPGRSPVALAGKVWCQVDADFGAIGLGDLLTTSPTPGHAMRAGDPARAFGAVVGKALGSLNEGRGLLPILVALQ